MTLLALAAASRFMNLVLRAECSRTPAPFQD
jgi:hypothetical protein